MNVVVCPHCGTQVDATGIPPGTDVTCGVCREVMRIAGPRPLSPGERRRSREGPGGRGERGSPPSRGRPSREQVRARTAISVVQVLYIVFAVLSGIGSAFLFAGFSALGLLGEPLVILVLALMFGKTVLYIVGALKIRSNPMLWAILIAALQTLGALNALRNPLNLWGIVDIAVAVACWVAVAAISSAGRTLHRNSEEGRRQTAMAERRRLASQQRQRQRQRQPQRRRV